MSCVRNFGFEGVPERFDVIEVRRVARQRQQEAAHWGENRFESCCVVKRSIIENHHLARTQLPNQLLRKPRFNQRRIAVTLKG